MKKAYYINGSNNLATEAEYQKNVDGTIKIYVVANKVVSGTVETFKWNWTFIINYHIIK